MQTNRRIAIAVGVMFIIATVAALASAALLAPILSAPDHLTKISSNQNQVLLGALLQFIAAAACPGIALAMYPVLRRYDEGLALGSVGFRIIEGALYVIAVVCLLLLVTVSSESIKAGVPTSSVFQIQAALLMAARDWLGPVSAVLTFGLGALMYYWVLYRWRLVPRWLSAWGLVGIALVMVSGLLVMFRLTGPLSATQVVLAVPIAVQEMVLAVWLIAKGFDPVRAPRGEVASRPSRGASATTSAGA